ncbi:MAG: NADH-quinone oxidoreductase subunit N [Actinobacteria bacterium]|nr:NADH-quinone oxidoreductase subunit N [Actinomycetota bacterium]
MADVWRLIPEFLVLGGALVALFAERARSDSRVSAGIAAAFAAAAAVAAAVIGPGGDLFGGQLSLDHIAVFARVAIGALATAWLLWVWGRGVTGERCAEAAALALFSVAGGMLMASARDLIVLYVSLELSTIPAYVLMGYRRDDARGLEGALKYFLLSMLTSLVMLYGLSFVFGISGSTSYGQISLGAAGPLGQVAFVLVLVGLFAKLSAAPFHYWTPDAYAGAQAGAVAYVSTVPKIAGVVALVRLVGAMAPNVAGASGVLVVAAVFSMVLGNLAAFPQSDVRRMMAYSGVAHTGYILLATGAGTAGGPAAVFYAVAYAVPSMAVMMLAEEEGPALDDLGGLASRRPAVAWASLAWLLSLVGIPPVVGFFGKLYLFTSAVRAGFIWPVLVAVAMSVVSAGYYFRLIRSAFLGQRKGAPVVERRTSAATAFVLITVIVLALGVLASPVLAFLGMRF